MFGLSTNTITVYQYGEVVRKGFAPDLWTILLQLGLG
jgi:hypothetical protein